MAPTLERSVYYCCTASRELILKDMAWETDESRVRRAAHVMAQSLAINLALVTCKDLLRSALTTHLRTSLQAAVQSLQLPESQAVAMVDQAVRFALTENLDLALAAIETVAAEKAVQQVDEALHNAIAVCRKGTAYRVLVGFTFTFTLHGRGTR
jgi:CCR4-NOT transcription complex subunit 1